MARSAEIRTLLRRGRRKKTRHLDVFWTASPVAHSRMGLVVPKYRFNGVARNRLKRRLREIGRRELLPRARAEGCEVEFLVRARREAYAASFAELRSELVGWMEEQCSRPR